jgi:hypothetical protein
MAYKGGLYEEYYTYLEGGIGIKNEAYEEPLYWNFQKVN